MARREVNIFSVAFLDLLSGALGAVLILFIVVPKLTAENQDALETLDELDVRAENIAAMLEQLENSVDRSVVEAIEAEVQAMQATITELRTEVDQIQRERNALRGRVEELESRTEQQAAALTATEQRIEQQRQQMERMVEATPPPPPPATAARVPRYSA